MLPWLQEPCLSHGRRSGSHPCAIIGAWDRLWSLRSEVVGGLGGSGLTIPVVDRFDLEASKGAGRFSEFSEIIRMRQTLPSACRPGNGSRLSPSHLPEPVLPFASLGTASICSEDGGFLRLLAPLL